MPPLSISGTTIRIQDNLYCLNDLHQASGNAEQHKPSNFLRNDQTKALIAEIQGSNLRLEPAKVFHGGKNRGTFVCRELVYAYAMWISPKFNLAVIRAFDQMQATPFRDQKMSEPKTLPDNHIYWSLQRSQAGQATLTPITEKVLCDFIREHYPHLEVVNRRIMHDNFGTIINQLTQFAGQFSTLNETLQRFTEWEQGRNV